MISSTLISSKTIIMKANPPQTAVVSYSTGELTPSSKRGPSTKRSSAHSISDNNGSSSSTAFPGVDVREDDLGYQVESGFGGGDREQRAASSIIVDRLLEKVPQSVWQPKAVVQRHRQKANLYWLLLLVGYGIYIALAIRSALERRKAPPVQLTRVDEAFQLPDVGFCFEGDTYGSRFGCFDGEADGKDCADSYNGDVFVYGYNYTGYTTPDGYPDSDEYIVLLPDRLSDTCRRFPLSTLTATTDGNDWRFHMLMFWNSSYNATLNPGAFQSIKMYLYQGDLTPEEVVETPITLYAPISTDAAEVPFVRGFLEYERQVLLDGHVDHTFKVVDTTTAPWYNAEDAVELAALYGTDSLASIQLDIRALSYFQYTEVDPMDIVGTLGEISGFWLVVPFLFGLLFYRRGSEHNDDNIQMREFNVCGRRKFAEAQTDFTSGPSMR